MKKLLALLLALVILLSLSACGKNEAESTASDSSPSHTSSDGSDSSSNSSEKVDQDPSEDSSTTPEEDKEETLTPSPDENHKEPTTKPSPESGGIKPPSSEVSTEKPDEKPSEPSSDCEHSYIAATCATPKICTKCKHVAGRSLPHNYKNGVCTVCGWSEIVFNIKKGDWVSDSLKIGTSEQGEILTRYVLTDHQFASVICYSNPDACLVNFGKVIYKGKTYYADYYYLAFSTVEREETENTLTVTSRGEKGPQIVFNKTSETQLTVASANDNAHIPVGTVLQKQ